MLSTYEGGNDDMRVPYIGYSAESESYKAIGVSNYNALQTHVEKRLSHGVQVGFSYTWSHALDEQSALGLFYNGNNPLDPHNAYASSDFDRTHVMNFNYLYQFPNFVKGNGLAGKIANGWAIQGIAVIESGQPYSVVDYTGAVGSIFYGTTDGITNPIVPLAPGCTAYNAVTGASGAGATPALKASCFTLPLLQPGDLGGAIRSRRHVRNQLHFRPAQHLPPGLAEARRHFSGQGPENHRAGLVEIHAGLFSTSPTPPASTFPSTTFRRTSTTTISPTRRPRTLYNAPVGLGQTNKTIGGPRQIQMSLHLAF